MAVYFQILQSGIESTYAEFDLNKIQLNKVKVKIRRYYGVDLNEVLESHLNEPFIEIEKLNIS